VQLVHSALHVAPVFVAFCDFDRLFAAV